MRAGTNCAARAVSVGSSPRFDAITASDFADLMCHTDPYKLSDEEIGMAKATNKIGKSRHRRAAAHPDTLMETKARFAIEAARSGKLLEGDKTHLLSARLNEGLVAAAKERTGITSDTKLVELALASLAVGDDFGEWLVTQGGRLKADFEIDI